MWKLYCIFISKKVINYWRFLLLLWPIYWDFLTFHSYLRQVKLRWVKLRTVSSKMNDFDIQQNFFIFLQPESKTMLFLKIIGNYCLHFSYTNILQQVYKSCNTLLKLTRKNPIWWNIQSDCFNKVVNLVFRKASCSMLHKFKNHKSQMSCWVR